MVLDTLHMVRKLLLIVAVGLLGYAAYGFGVFGPTGSGGHHRRRLIVSAAEPLPFLSTSILYWPIDLIPTNSAGEVIDESALTTSVGILGTGGALPTEIHNGATNAYSFDGGDDIAITNLTISSITNATQGTVALWVFPDQDDNLNNMSTIMFSAAAGNVTEMYTYFVVSAGDFFRVGCGKDTGTSWIIDTTNDFTDAHIGKWMWVMWAHDGSQPTNLMINGVPEPYSFTSSGDKTVFWKGIFTDAANDADSITLGAWPRNGSIITHMFGDFESVVLYTNCLSMSDGTNLFNFMNDPAFSGLSDL